MGELIKCTLCNELRRGPEYTLCEKHFKEWQKNPTVRADGSATAYIDTTVKVHDPALNCQHDLFDKLVDYAETRHKDWNMVFANCLREINNRMKEIQDAVNRMETRGLL